MERSSSGQYLARGCVTLIFMRELSPLSCQRLNEQLSYHDSNSCMGEAEQVGVVRLPQDLLLILSGRNQEASQFSLIVFDRHGRIRSKFAEELTALEESSRFTFVSEVIVDRPHRGQGFGSAALEALHGLPELQVSSKNYHRWPRLTQLVFLRRMWRRSLVAQELPNARHTAQAAHPRHYNVDSSQPTRAHFGSE